MNVNIVLYDEFETLDALGIANIFGMAPEHFYINYLSVNGGLVSSKQGVKVWTELLIPEEVEGILVLPGGRTATKLLCLEPKKLEIIKAAAQEADICMMIANASSILAQTGLLYHRQIADYPGDQNWKRMFTAEIRRAEGVNWISDGKFYSCSSTMAGFDMALGVISDMVDIELAVRIAEMLGYEWNQEMLF